MSLPPGMGLMPFTRPVVKAAARNRDRGNRVFEDQLFQISRLQHERELIETANLSRKFHSPHQVNRNIDTVSAEIIQETVLNVLRILSVSVHFSPNRLSLFYSFIFDFCC